ncbi:MAG: RDD family protein [Bacilli bacterium]|jgi:uncharacterized RDD family membrane protein YckC
MENQIKVTNIIHPGPGKRAVAATIDLAIAAAVGMLFFYLLSSFVFTPISEAVPTYDVQGFHDRASEVMDIQVDCGLFYYDNDDQTSTAIYTESETYQEYDAKIQNYYFVYLQTPDLIPLADAAKYTPYWYNVFVYGLDDEQGLYSEAELAARYDIVKAKGKLYFEYNMSGETAEYDVLATTRADQHLEGNPASDLTDDAKTSLLQYFYNGNLNYSSYGEGSIYILTIDSDFASRPFFSEVYAEYKTLEYQATLWQILIPEVTAIFLVAILVYFVMPLILKNGKTVGKYIMSIGLVNKLGYDVSIPQLVLRFFFPLVVVIGLLIIGGVTFALGTGLFVLVSYTLVIFTKEHKAIHDFLAGTVAIESKKSVWFKNATEEAKYTEKINAMKYVEIEKPLPIDDEKNEK